MSYDSTIVSVASGTLGAITSAAGQILRRFIDSFYEESSFQSAFDVALRVTIWTCGVLYNFVGVKVFLLTLAYMRVIYIVSLLPGFNAGCVKFTKVSELLRKQLEACDPAAVATGGKEAKEYHERKVRLNDTLDLLKYYKAQCYTRLHVWVESTIIFTLTFCVPIDIVCVAILFMAYQSFIHFGAKIRRVLGARYVRYESGGNATKPCQPMALPARLLANAGFDVDQLTRAEQDLLRVIRSDSGEVVTPVDPKEKQVVRPYEVATEVETHVTDRLLGQYMYEARGDNKRHRIRGRNGDYHNSGCQNTNDEPCPEPLYDDEQFGGEDEIDPRRVTITLTPEEVDRLLAERIAKRSHSPDRTFVHRVESSGRPEALADSVAIHTPPEGPKVQRADQCTQILPFEPDVGMHSPSECLKIERVDQCTQTSSPKPKAGKQKKQTVVCPLCKEHGHSMNNCPHWVCTKRVAESKMKSARICTYCKRAGHIEENCRWKRYAKQQAVKQPAKQDAAKPTFESVNPANPPFVHPPVMLVRNNADTVIGSAIRIGPYCVMCKHMVEGLPGQPETKAVTVGMNVIPSGVHVHNIGTDLVAISMVIANHKSIHPTNCRVPVIGDRVGIYDCVFGKSSCGAVDAVTGNEGYYNLSSQPGTCGTPVVSSDGKIVGIHNRDRGFIAWTNSTLQFFREQPGKQRVNSVAATGSQPSGLGPTFANNVQPAVAVTSNCTSRLSSAPNV